MQQGKCELPNQFSALKYPARRPVFQCRLAFDVHRFAGCLESIYEYLRVNPKWGQRACELLNEEARKQAEKVVLSAFRDLGKIAGHKRPQRHALQLLA